MCLFFTAVVSSGDDVEQQVHGPFESEEDRDECISELEEEFGEDVFICELSALVSGDEVNLLVG